MQALQTIVLPSHLNVKMANKKLFSRQDARFITFRECKKDEKAAVVRRTFEVVKAKKAERDNLVKEFVDLREQLRRNREEVSSEQVIEHLRDLIVRRLLAGPMDKYLVKGRTLLSRSAIQDLKLASIACKMSHDVKL